MRVLIVGCGFVGNELAKQLHAAQHTTASASASRGTSELRVFALTRTAERCDALRAIHVEPIVAHWLDEVTLDSLPEVDVVVVSVPHREDAGLGIETHIVGLKNLRARLPAGWHKLIYLSTTGVYGDLHDEVDESTPTQPTRIGPQIAVATETWLQHEFTAPQLAIIRLAGIYGPGRIPLAEKLRAGEPLQVPQAGWLNLIHVSDIASMLRRLMQVEARESLYVFSDGNPVARMDFYRTLAKLCGVDEPKFVEPDPNSSRVQRAGKKRVNPRRLIEELNLRLQFPSYQEGLADCLTD